MENLNVQRYLELRIKSSIIKIHFISRVNKNSILRKHLHLWNFIDIRVTFTGPKIFENWIWIKDRIKERSIERRNLSFLYLSFSAPI